MLGKAFRLIAVAKMLDPGKVGAIERFRRADIHTDAMHGKRVVFPQKSQLRVRNASRTHVVFSVNLEKAERLRACGDSREMFRLVANASARR